MVRLWKCVEESKSLEAGAVCNAGYTAHAVGSRPAHADPAIARPTCQLPSKGLLPVLTFQRPLSRQACTISPSGGGSRRTRL